jgi:hypothetical protein
MRLGRDLPDRIAKRAWYLIIDLWLREELANIRNIRREGERDNYTNHDERTRR